MISEHGQKIKGESMAKKTPAYLQTLSKGIQVLEYLVEHNSTTVTSMAKHLSLQKSASYRFLNTFKLHGYVVQDQFNNYILTDRIKKLGNGIIPKIELHNIFVDILNSITFKFHAPADVVSNLGIWNGIDITYLAQNNNTMYSQFSEGGHVPAYCSALGKAVFSLLPLPEIEEYMKKTNFEQFTANTTKKENFLKELEITRTRGYSVMNDELCVGLKGVGIPVVIEGQLIQYALSLTRTIYGDASKFYEAAVPLLREAAEEIMGYLELKLF